MDRSTVGPGPLIAGASGILLIIFMFFGWFELTGVSVSGGGLEETVSGDQLLSSLSEQGFDDATVNAWQAFSLIDIVLFIAALAGIGLAVLAATGARLQLPVPAGIVVAALGGLSVILILIRIISPPDLLDHFGASVPEGIDAEADIGRKIGVWLGLLAAIGITIGGLLGMREEAEAAGTTAAPRRDVGGAPPPAPPPSGPPPTA
jgi:hypothetical protein